MEEFIFFHDLVMSVLVAIMLFVGVGMAASLGTSLVDKYLLEDQMIEIAWTLLPVIILVEIAVPSLTLLYILEEQSWSVFSVKATGHQWFWTYSSVLQDSGEEFEAYMSKEKGEVFRLLDVDSRLVMPMMTPLRVLVTASDVLHSWTVPSMGVKADAIPGRLNQLNILLTRAGVFYGQCSEICGSNHSYMPIVVEVK